MKRSIHCTLAIAALALVFGGGSFDRPGPGAHVSELLLRHAECVVLRPGKCQRHRHLHESESVPPVQLAQPWGRPYEEPVYTSNSPYGYPPAVSQPYPNNTYPPPNFRSYPRGVFTQPLPRATDYHGYNPAVPGVGYYYGPGPFEYAHYDRSGRMAFRYGWW